MPDVTRGHGSLERFLAKRRAKTADRLIPPDLREGRILDIGCGTYPWFLARTRFSEKYGLDQVVRPEPCVDLDAQGIRLQNHHLESGKQMPFENDYFDVITMLAVVEHLSGETLGRIVSEVRRMLKGGGLYIVTTPNGWTGPLLKALGVMKLVSREEIDDHKTSYYPSMFLPALTAAGFTGDRIRSGYFELYMNFWVTAEK